MRIQVGEQGHEVDVEAHCKWDQGKDSSQCRQQYRNDSGLAGFDHGGPRPHAPGPQLISEFDHQNTVLDHDTGESNDADTGGHCCEGGPEHRVSQEHTDHAEENLRQNDHGPAIGIELQDQDQQDQSDRSEQRGPQEGHGLFQLFTFTGLCYAHRFRLAFEGIDVFFDLCIHRLRGIALGFDHVGEEGDHPFLVFAFDASVGIAEVSLHHGTDRHLPDLSVRKITVGDPHVQQF